MQQVGIIAISPVTSVVYLFNLLSSWSTEIQSDMVNSQYETFQATTGTFYVTSVYDSLWYIQTCLVSQKKRNQNQTIQHCRNGTKTQDQNCRKMQIFTPNTQIHERSLSLLTRYHSSSSNFSEIRVVCSIFSFLLNVLWTIVWLFVFFFFIIVLSGLLRLLIKRLTFKM
jgi:hypothetical protein